MIARLVRGTAFYALVAVIVVVAVFPFYYAILTSLKSGTALFEVDYWPKAPSLPGRLMSPSVSKSSRSIRREPRPSIALRLNSIKRERPFTSGRL